MKNLFFFFKCSEKMVFPKKLHWNIICFVLPGKMIFLFPENMIWFLRQKMKDDLSKKSTWKYDIFFKYSEKMVFPKKSHWNMTFLVLPGKIVFFYLKIWYFFFGRNWKMIFLKKYMEIWYFLYMCINVTKKAKTIFSRENTIKGDWHSRLTF